VTVLDADSAVDGRRTPHSPGVQHVGAAPDGVVGTYGLARWTDVATSRWLGRWMKPTAVTSSFGAM
jgi:hypothetical protein